MMDQVYMLVHNEGGIWYSPPGTSAVEAWSKATSWEELNHARGFDPYLWRERMYNEGWRAKKVAIGRLEK